MCLNIPIIYIHIGWSDYLQYSIQQARRRNPMSRIILLGTEENDRFDHIEHYNIKEYFHSAKEFEKIYQHMSTNNIHFEKFCFSRWFILNEFVKFHNIYRFFTTDSDTLLFCDVNEEAEKFKNFRYTTTNRISAGITFIMDLTVLNEWCQLTTNIYSKKDKFNFNKCFYHFKNLQENGRAGGANDMTIWDIFSNDGYNNPGMVGETSTIFSDDTTFDHNINQSDFFEMENGIKKIKWFNKNPYGYNQILKRDIRFLMLHFQGGAKSFMKEYAN